MAQKSTPLSADEACTWLMFATLEGAEVIEDRQGQRLILTRDDGASLVVSFTINEFTFVAEGSTQ